MRARSHILRYQTWNSVIVLHSTLFHGTDYNIIRLCESCECDVAIQICMCMGMGMICECDDYIQLTRIRLWIFPLLLNFEIYMNISERPDPTQTKQHCITLHVIQFEACPFHASHTIHRQPLLEIGFCCCCMYTDIFVIHFFLIFGLICHKVVYRGHDFCSHFLIQHAYTFDAVFCFHFVFIFFFFC